MIRVIEAFSPNQALSEGLRHLAHFGVMRESRNGPVLVSKMPVITSYQKPQNRLLISERRNANPFFHLVEALWMLAGRNDLYIPELFVKRFADFSDDGKTLHGAYGYRWRRWFGYDQLEMITAELKRNPDSRRCVLTMWHGGNGDFYNPSDVVFSAGDMLKAVEGGKDVPCNTHAYFDITDGKLNMTVLCRSNDIIWGAYGANLVHFSVLLEYMAHMIGVPMGVYRQFSNNYHAYADVLKSLAHADMLEYAEEIRISDIYLKTTDFRPTLPQEKLVRYVPLFDNEETVEQFDADNRILMEMLEAGAYCRSSYTTLFFRHVVDHMLWAWQQHKQGDTDECDDALSRIKAGDWRTAASEWVNLRRMKNV